MIRHKKTTNRRLSKKVLKHNLMKYHKLEVKDQRIQRSLQRLEQKRMYVSQVGKQITDLNNGLSTIVNQSTRHHIMKMNEALDELKMNSIDLKIEQKLHDSCSEKRYKRPKLNLSLLVPSSPKLTSTTLSNPSNLRYTSNNSFQWVYDLKTMDCISDYSMLYLVIVRGKTKKTVSMSWTDLKKIDSSKLMESISEILVIPRSNYGQFYIVFGLHSSLHFSLGSNGQQTLSNFLSCHNIKTHVVNGHESNTHIPDTIFVKTAIQHKKSNIETGYYTLMLDMASHMWPYLLKRGKNSTEIRAKHLINLGITDQKCHEYQRITITGRTALNLISTTTRDIDLSTCALKSIGNLIMFIINHILPTTKYPNIFKIRNKYEREYLNMFAKQLCITNKTYLEKFGVPAVSILVNQDLNPHYDSMNPVNISDDSTFSLNLLVPIKSLPLCNQQLLKEKFPSGVPLCVVLYKRKALCNYTKRMLAVDQYAIHHSGRIKIVELLRKVNHDVDYIGRFFSQDRKEILSKFEVEKKPPIVFKGKMLVCPEAVDKMAYFSSLLHVWFMFCYKFGLDRDDAFEFVLFFAHQCNSTVTIVTAMLRIITRLEKRSDWSMYKMLTKVCLSVNKKQDKKNNVDVGGGKHNRHSPSSNTILKWKEINNATKLMKTTFITFGESMTCNKKLGLRDRLKLFCNLQQQLKDIPGIGDFRSIHMILLSALVGILPLEFYLYVPMHYSGGPRSFLIQYMNYRNYKHCEEDKNTRDKLLTWTANELKELQSHFTKNLTANMFENAACMIGRKSMKKDVFYFLPWYNDVTSELTSDRIQLCFRLKQEESNTWNLEAFDGKNIYCFLSTDSKKSTIVKFSMKNHQIFEQGHMVDKEKLRRFFC